MIGNEEHAQEILDWALTAPDAAPPKGWKRLGQGCYRQAMLHIETNVVYKVQHNYSVRYSQSNDSEAENLRRYWLKKLPQGCRFPRYQLFRFDGKGVMAMERFGKLLRDVSRYGEDSRYWERHSKLQDVLRNVYDLHGANLAIDEENDQLVPIDMGG
jgi:hypothetical protein